jgi:hypothetical protein
MSSAEKYNEFLAKNGGSILNADENLMLFYEDKKERIYWASVYDKEARKVPKGFFTSQSVYRDFCVAVSGMMPKKRSGEKFDDYIRERLIEASVKETLPGLEEGVVAGQAVLSVIRGFYRKACDYDEPERNVPEVYRGDPYFVETRPEGPGYKEIFVRVNNLMVGITNEKSTGQLERNITRDEVVEWLLINGRTPYPATGVSPRRLRSTYPIPHHLFMNWRDGDERPSVWDPEVKGDGAGNGGSST